MKRRTRMEGCSSVYDSDNFEGRVNFASAVITSGRNTTRNFDTCFEMWDGHEVAEAIRRRALKNPKLAVNLPRYINVMDCEKELGHLTRKQLAEHAAATRRECEIRSAR